MQKFVDAVGVLMKDTDFKTFCTIRSVRERYSVVFFDKVADLNPLINLAKKHRVEYETPRKNRIDFKFKDAPAKIKRWKEKPWKFVKSEPIPLSSLNNNKKPKEIKLEELEKLIDEVENEK